MTRTLWSQVDDFRLDIIVRDLQLDFDSNAAVMCQCNSALMNFISWQIDKELLLVCTDLLSSVAVSLELVLILIFSYQIFMCNGNTCSPAER